MAESADAAPEQWAAPETPIEERMVALHEGF